MSLVAAGLALLLSGPVQGRVPEVDLRGLPNVLWYENDHGERLPLFVPEAALPAKAEALPMTPDLRSTLETRIADARSKRIDAKAHEDEPACSGPIIGDTVPGVVDEFEEGHRLEAIGRRQVSFLGRVVGVVPGLLVPDSHVESLVRVRVEEIYSGASRLEPGQQVTYLQDSGSIRFEGERLCTEAPEFYSATVGDEVIVAGDWDPVNPQHVQATRFSVFPIVNGDVQPPPSSLKKESPKPLEHIRQALQAQPQ